MKSVKSIFMEQWEKPTQQLARVDSDTEETVQKKVLEYMQRYNEYGFTAETLAARIDTASPAILIAKILYEHSDSTFTTYNNSTYFYLSE